MGRIGLNIPGRHALSQWRLRGDQAVGMEVSQATFSSSDVDQPAPDDVTGSRFISIRGAVEAKKYLAGNNKVRVFNCTRLYGKFDNITPTNRSLWTVRPSIGRGVAYVSV